MVTDHYLSHADLDSISQRVQRGEPLTFDPKQIDEFVETIKEIKPDRFIGLFVIGCLALVIAALAGAAWVVLRLWQK